VTSYFFPCTIIEKIGKNIINGISWIIFELPIFDFINRIYIDWQEKGGWQNINSCHYTYSQQNTGNTGSPSPLQFCLFHFWLQTAFPYLNNLLHYIFSIIIISIHSHYDHEHYFSAVASWVIKPI